ncbi:tetratricopeptide repeat protein [Sulfurimonas aquatica]|nr:tetratricopeptide repeat protein [Sulfurimonas aquatica]
MITFFSYWWGRYKRKEDSKYLDRFLKQFNSLPSKNELEVLISSGELSEKSWLLLANSYYKSGDYEKSIEIYQELLKIKSSSNTKETMFLLGKTYFKAGFLERSKQIFLEILKKSPRTPQALHYLLLVYEYMRDYNSALDVLEPLDELHEDVALESAYLKVMHILSRSDISIDKKADKLLAIHNETHKLTYMIFEYLFRVNPKLAWQNLDSSKSELLSDIFWAIDTKELNLDIISQNGYLRDLYSARGDIALSKSSSIFELNVLIKLQNKGGATLIFEYVCDGCKQVYPFAFNRCSSCHSLDTLRVEWHLSKDFYQDYTQENNSFQ